MFILFSPGIVVTVKDWDCGKGKIVNISIKKWIDKAAMPVVFTDDGKYCFLIDTGATFNVLSRKTFDKDPDSFVRENVKKSLIGMEGSPHDVFIAKGMITLGGEDIMCSFGVLDDIYAIASLYALTGLRIDGALGIDFLVSNGFIVDFVSMELRTA